MSIKMTRTEVRELAQDLILQTIAGSYYKVEYQDLKGDDEKKVYAEIQKQSDRVAKFLGYDSQPFRA
jgi:elongation factor P hydroxylase